MRDVAAIEANFLGCLLRSPDEFWAITDMVAAEMFSVPVHQRIYDGIRFLCEAGRGVSFATLRAHLPPEDDAGVPYVSHLAVLKENAIDAGSATDYAGAISERSAGSRIATLGEWMAKEIRGGKRSPEEVSGEAALTLQEIMTCASPTRPKRIGDIAGEVLRHASAARNGEVLHGLNTGIASLDAILGLMLAGDLGAIIASQGDGKTVLAAQIGAHAAEAGRPVLFEQLEMSDEQMGARELAAASGIPVNHIHEGAFDAFQWEQIVEAERHLRTLPFHIIDTEETTVRQIESQALTMQRMGGLSLVIIDQLDKIIAVGKYRDRFERMAEITRDLKKMAKRLKVPVLVLAQRTRGAQRRDDATPHVLDADAPSLERDCDWILGLWQVANWMRQNKPDSRKVSDYEDWNTKTRVLEGKAEIIILKRRRGRAFQQCELKFEGARMRFMEAT